MKYISELRVKFPEISEKLTTIQREPILNHYRQEIEKYIGNEIEFDIFKTSNNSYTRIEDITLNTITIFSYDGIYGLQIRYNIENFRNQLKAINKGDYVKCTAILKDASFSEKRTFLNIERGAYYGEANYSFELASIKNIDKEIRQELERDRKESEEKKKEKEEKKESGCFIATACFGNYDAPEVKILRQYRDNVLLKSFIGKIIVSIYYFISPPFARLIEKSEMLKKVIRKYLLNHIISKILQK